MDYVYALIGEMDRKLERPIRDLDDVRLVMDTLKKIREQEIDMELKIEPIEVIILDTFVLLLIYYIYKVFFIIIYGKFIFNIIGMI